MSNGMRLGLGGLVLCALLGGILAISDHRDQVLVGELAFDRVELRLGAGKLAKHGDAVRWVSLGLNLQDGLGLRLSIGTGDEQTDIVAHGMGLLAGMLIGAVAAKWIPRRPPDRWQVLAGGLSLALLGVSWGIAAGHRQRRGRAEGAARQLRAEDSPR